MEESGCWPGSSQHSAGCTIGNVSGVLSGAPTEERQREWVRAAGGGKRREKGGREDAEGKAASGGSAGGRKSLAEDKRW